MRYHLSDDEKVDTRAAWAAHCFRHGEIVIEARQHRYELTPGSYPRHHKAPRPGGAFEKPPHDCEQLRLLQQECVVTLVGLDLGK